MLIGHKKQWNFLKTKFLENQLSHAYLFTGEKQLGKRTLAKEFVKMINCLSSQILKSKTWEDEPCQKCINCQMIEKGSFPDLMDVKSEEGQELQISKIREIQNFLSYKSYYSSTFKAVIVDDAEKMNQEAQSCFLKTLEEPKGKTLLILISSRPEMLLPTIFSRCQIIKFFPVKRQDMEKYLQACQVGVKKAEMLAWLSEGKPGRVENFLSDPEKIEKEKTILEKVLKVLDSDLSEKFKYVKSFDIEKSKPSEILELLQRYFRQLLFLKTGIGEKDGQNYFFEKKDFLKNYPISKIKRDIRLIEDINSKLLFTNVNPKLALEVLLMEI